MADAALAPIAQQAQGHAELVDLGADAPIARAVLMRAESALSRVLAQILCLTWASTA